MYCETEFKNQVMAEIPNATYIDATVSQKELRNLDEKKGRYYRLLVSDSPDIALRGLDYRSFNNGIMLVVMKPFKHQREMLQAANRLNRGGDRGSRVVD